MSGEITGINQALLSDPSMLKEDPYGKGWICSIKPTDMADRHQVDSISLKGRTAGSGRELDRIRDFLAVTANKYNPESHAVYMQDGGELAEYPLASMPKEAWDDFQAEFLK
ncbi:MAG: hypothetical protein MZV63_00915 [Marinilabiliales bacterium]|nr:hypothetical protein [Marinilabiliales bacterium]